jgi:hypothetical protein
MNDQPSDNAQQPPQSQSALLLSATLYLLSQAAINTPCLGRARMVIEHLEMVASDTAIDPALRATTLQLRLHWLALHADLVEREAHSTATASGASLPRGFLH